jgi:hypothetical protein
MRTRKPWVLLRRRRFGWNVLFMRVSLQLRSETRHPISRAPRCQCRTGDTDARRSRGPSSARDNFFLSTPTPYARLRPSSGRHRRNASHGDGVPRMDAFPHLLKFLWKTPSSAR